MTNRTKRLGILGGTFDPIHVGHTQLASRAIDELLLDEVLIVPTGNPHFKQTTVVASGADRLEMCKLATSVYNCFSVSDIELLREGVTYTFDTLLQLKDIYGESTELFFLLGADSAAGLNRWYKSDELAHLAKFRVFPRLGIDVDSYDSLKQFGYDIEQIDIQLPDISSSTVREAVKKGTPINNMVHPDVESYIYNNHLYL